MPTSKVHSALIVIAALFAALATPSDSFAQPAPKISAVGIFGVHSANSQAWVYPYPGQYSTHGEGGSWVVVCTKEMGYGQPISATINGYPGTQMTQLNSPVIQNGYIVGWYRYWYFQGNNLNGEFVYSVRSLNSPFNTMTAWIYIE